jgi:hypothetical protein
LFSPLAQVIAGLFWVTLAFVVGLVWSRVFFGSTTIAEVFLVGALLGAAGFPVVYACVVMLLKLLAVTSVLPPVSFTGEPQIYALLSLFVLLLLGILLLIGKEVLRALQKPA